MKDPTVQLKILNMEHVICGRRCELRSPKRVGGEVTLSGLSGQSVVGDWTGMGMRGICTQVGITDQVGASRQCGVCCAFNQIGLSHDKWSRHTSGSTVAVVGLKGIPH